MIAVNNCLSLTESMHRMLKEHLFPGDGLESAAILLCHRGEGTHEFRLMVKDLLLIPARKCERRTVDSISWPFANHMNAKEIERIDSEGLCVFTIHSHPSDDDGFSDIDDANDKSLLAAVNGWFNDARPNGALIMLPDGLMQGRIFDGNGRFSTINRICVVGEDIKIWYQDRARAEVPEYARRIAQTFGKGTLNLLRRMKVAVVGCSGTGSVMAELLARNCVGTLVLVDPDRVEEKNLNRIVNAGKRDAKRAVAKVEVLKRAIGEMGTGTAVETYCTDTYGERVLEALVECDVLFGCVDSAVGRYHLDCVASAYLIPYFDVGVYLEADQGGGISQADAVAHYVHPESPSLLDRGAYTSEQLRAEDIKRDDPESYKRWEKEGYLQGVAEDQPAVMSVNMQAACLAFNDLLARVHKFRIDDNQEFAVQRIQLVQGYYSNERAGSVGKSIFKNYQGMGDRSPLIKNLRKARQRQISNE